MDVSWRVCNYQPCLCPQGVQSREGQEVAGGLEGWTQAACSTLAPALQGQASGAPRGRLAVPGAISGRGATGVQRVEPRAASRWEFCPDTRGALLERP